MRLTLRRGALKFILLLAGLVILVAAGLLLLSRWEQGQQVVAPSAGSSPTAEKPLVYYQGGSYTPRQDIETILLLGLDKFQADAVSESYNNNQQADFLLLLVLDQAQAQYTVLRLNRDTMTEIPVLGVRGEDAGTVYAQLALAHTYGSGGSDSCRNAVAAVRNLLYGAEIDHYIAFTMDVVPLVTDAVGGVSLTLTADFSASDPTMTEGATLTLNGEQALSYVQARGSLADSTNLARMERQQQYLLALAASLRTAAQADEGLLPSTLAQITPYLESDCDANRLSRLLTQLQTFSQEEILTVAGEVKDGAEFVEFYPDEEALRELVMSCFYQPYTKEE